MMDYFKQNKVILLCVTVLVILNVVTLGSFWLKKPPFAPMAGRPDRMDRPEGQKIMQERLALSEKQAADFERMRNEHFARTKPLQEHSHKIRLQILDELFCDQPNEKKIQALLSQLSEKQAEFEKSIYQHFKDLKAACNQQQVHELKSMLTELIESTRPKGPNGQPGPQARPRPPICPEAKRPLQTH